MSATSKGQRRAANRQVSDPCVVRIEAKDGLGNPRWITADLIDTSDTGIGIMLMAALKVGSTILVRGHLGPGKSDAQLRAAVSWCVETGTGKFRAGLEFLNAGKGPSNGDRAAQADSEDPADLDLYEVMQLNANADIETIHRVYRLLAQRYHPDNTRTGNSEFFVKLSEAYRILSNPEERAAYDARRKDTIHVQWRIFDQAVATAGPDVERRKRHGILGLLYAKTLHDPERASMTIHAFEEMLACPKEHLEAALWYLRGKGYIQRSDNGKYVITVQGFEEAEQHYIAPSPVDHQLPEAAASSPK